MALAVGVIMGREETEDGIERLAGAAQGGERGRQVSGKDTGKIR